MELIEVLKNNRKEFGLVLDLDYRNDKTITFDFSSNNKELREFDIADIKAFESYVFRKLEENDVKVSVGGYLESRTIYDHSEIFGGENRRIIHLGIDLWCKAGVKVLTPLKGCVHSFNNNVGFGDYGPTIILEHNLDGITFYTLYGHLSLDSIEDLKVGQVFEKGDVIPKIGDSSINGN